MKKFLLIIGLVLAVSPANIVSGQESSAWNNSNLGLRDIDSASPMPAVRRFWSNTYKGHFYTADTPEATYIMNNYPTSVWNPEGTVFYSIYPATEYLNGCDYLENTMGIIPGGTCYPVYRFWSDTYKHHFYTMSESEKTNIMMNMPEWSYEGVSYAALTTPAGALPGLFKPLYRFWSNSYKSHFYTISETERTNILMNMPEWQYEGIAYYVPIADLYIPGPPA